MTPNRGNHLQLSLYEVFLIIYSYSFNHFKTMKNIIFSFLMMLCTFCMVSSPCGATTVDVIYNANSGINGASYTATLSDGTILGFSARGTISASSFQFVGAISTKNSITVPDSLRYDQYGNGTPYLVQVNQCGTSVYLYDYEELDFSKAKSVTTLTLPPTINYLYSLYPSIKILHLKKYIESSYVNTNALNDVEQLFVPSELYDSYLSDKTWRQNVMILEEGKQPLKLAIKMTKPGEFAQLVLAKTDNWLKVNELTVTGELNSDDLNVFKRMSQLSKLNLSKAIITDIPDEFGAAYSLTGTGDGFFVLQELTLPELNSIGNSAFSSCKKLNKVIIPKVNSIGSNAFSSCSSLTKITLPSGLASIGSSAFDGSGLTSISIPSSITQIDDYCFDGCRNLETITIPASVISIGGWTFRNCVLLKSISLTGVKTIGSNAFYSCEQLSSVKFAEGLKEIGSSAFSNCMALKEIDLPSTISVASSAFHGCTNIKKVTCRAVTPPSLYNGFILSGCDMTDVKLYVPSFSIDSYRANNKWKEFYTILAMPDKIKDLRIYDNMTISDASGISSSCDVRISWRYDSDSRTYYDGLLEYNAKQSLSMNEYMQYQSLGSSSRSNSDSYSAYAYNARFTSLINNGTMTAGNIKTVLRFSSSSIWYFISLPFDVKVSDITYPEGCKFVIRKYSGRDRALMTGNTWQNLTADSIMHANEGYILRCNTNDADFTFPALDNAKKNNVFAKGNVEVPLSEYLSEFDHNRSWNLIGNPYPCYYDTPRMGFTSPFLVWNRYERKYDAYSPIDDEYILHPTQAFFIQAPVGKTSITFDKAGRQTDYEVQPLGSSVNDREGHMSERNIINVLMNDGERQDRTRIVLNENASRKYELDKDAAKFTDGSNASILLYTIENGVRFAINERCFDSGSVQLGFYAEKEGEYTLSMRSPQNVPVILLDRETNSKVQLRDGYTFATSAGFSDNRFTLLFGEATGIEIAKTENASIHSENGEVTANAPFTVYTTDGRLIANGDKGSSVHLNKGIYIVNSKDVKRKIVVK